MDLENDNQPEDDDVEDDKEDDEVEGDDEDDEVGGDQEDEMGDAQEVQDEVVPSEDKEDEIDNFMVVSGRDPIVKEGVRRWPELRDQIKTDLVVAHKDQKLLTTLNKLLVLQNFATLRIRGIGCIIASMQIAMQMADGVGTHLARHIRFIARHYQLFEQLPPQK